MLLADDPRWGAAVSPVLNAVGIELANAVSRWSAALLTLQDEDMFTAIDRFGLVGTDISDLAHGLDPVLETRLEVGGGRGPVDVAVRSVRG